MPCNKHVESFYMDLDHIQNNKFNILILKGFMRLARFLLIGGKFDKFNKNPVEGTMQALNRVLISAVFLFSAAVASANVIVNGDFEDDVGLSGTAWNVFNSINGWSTLSGPGIEVQHNTIVTAQSGDQYVELDSYGNSAMSQSISGLTAGQSYDLSFWFHARTNNGSNDNGIDVYWGDSAPGTLELSIVDAIFSDFTSGWQEFTLNLIASASTMYLTFSAAGWNNSLGGFVDNVSMTASVPEPGSLALLAIGLLGLALGRRRVN